VEYGILGPLAVWEDGRELLLGGRRRALLAMLLLRRNELVPTERLIEDLWGGSPPTTALPVVRNLVSQLRKALGDDALETRPLGYVLRVAAGALDLERFERLLEQGRAELGADRPAEAAAVLREALALWRGPPLADFRYEAFARDEIGRLEELRLVALEHRLEADLAAGRHAQAAPELETLVREHPLRERLRGLLMLALYRSGRQADALAAYHDGRAVLLDELGLDPDQSLQRLEKAILRQDPALDVPVPATAAVAAAVEEPAELPPRPARRRLVTVLVADVASPAHAGGSVDPETFRATFDRNLGRVKAAVRRHGGLVLEPPGDRVHAVFGLPAVHEDDALRALRAATEIRDAFAALGVGARIGVESGEIVAASDDPQVIGDVVRTASRLEQFAGAGEILAGDLTMALARGGVTTELVALDAADEGRPETAWRLRSVSAERPPPPFEPPLVGRRDELLALGAAWERARAERCCALVTVLGAAGMGKSRLVAEFALEAAAVVVTGRCLAYGSGVTYWPVVEMLGELRPLLGESEAATAGPLDVALGDEGASSTDEVAWAFRKLVEAVAGEQPLVLVFDDLQWAEDALLELVEHLVLVSSGVPILVVGIARPDLLERRPGWPGVLRLHPLTADEAAELIRLRLGELEPDAATSARIVTTSGGNPLFVEEMTAMLHESRGASVDVPPTIQALLAARLDQLEDAERAVLAVAAVEGEVFHHGAIRALAPEERRLPALLTALTRKELVRRERPQFAGEDAFRFHHLLLRDAAYDAIPKALRSELHERFASWLDKREVDVDAFVGYHLEQAYRYQVELGATGPETDALARRASEPLARAAHTALGRSDLKAAVGLLERSASLVPGDDPRRARLLTDLAATLVEAGELAEADGVLAEAETTAAAAGDGAAGARVLVERAFLELHRAAVGATDDAATLAEEVIPIFAAAGDERGLCRAWRFRAASSWIHGRVSAASDAWERAAEHALRSGEEHERAAILSWLASSTWLGAMPVDAGIARCESIRREVRGHPASEAEVLRALGGLHGFAGDFALARSLFAESNAAFEELGLGLDHVLSHPEAVVEMLAGDFAGAESRLRRGYDVLEALGENSVRSTTAGFLSRALLAQGRTEEARTFSELSERLAEPSDLSSHILWRGVRARILAADGRLDEAEGLARDAVELAAQTDLLNFRADALVDLAAVLDAAGRAADAATVVEEAIRLYEQKGNAVAAESAKAKLDALSAV
jgi:DNA-binding SARP family transcriptional activator